MNESYDEMERVFLALSDKTRIKLVGLMRDGEVSVNFLCQSLRESQPKISRHLAYLRSMGMVTTRRDGKWIYYSLAVPESRFGLRLLDDALGWIGSLNRIPKNEETRTRQQSKQIVTALENMPGYENEIYGNADMNEFSNELEVYLL